MSKKNNNKKHINHNPQSESVKAVFGEPKAKGENKEKLSTQTIFEVILMSKKNNNKKHINHNPQSESVKAVFGEPKAKGDEFTPKTFK